jgi:hypothetical protein
MRDIGPDLLWLYWEGPVPPYIEICLDLLRRYNPRSILVDRRTVDDISPAPPVDIDRLTVLHRSDYLRSHYLYHFGGVYCDADCIPLRPFDCMITAARRAPAGFCGYDSTDNTIGANFMASVPHGEIISEQYRIITHNVRMKRSLQWLDVSSVPMTEAVAGRRVRCIIHPNDAVQPVLWNEMHEMLVERDDSEHERFFNPDAICYMLCNQGLGDTVRRLSRDELLGSRRFLSFLLRKSMENAPHG